MSENTLSINESGHAERILRRLDSMRKEEKNCDFVISVDGRKLHVNKDVMSAASDYFDAMLSHDTKEKREGIVEMKDVQFSAVEKCIDFIYSGKLIASEDECEGLLFCASLMQLNEVCDKISPFLANQLNSKSFFKIRAVAIKFCLRALNTACDEFALDHILPLSEEKEFNNFDVDYVSFLLSSKKSSDAEAEDLKLKIALQWINSDLDDREKYLMKFVNILDTSRLSADYSKFLVENEPLCMKFPEFMKELFIGMAHAKTTGKLHADASSSSSSASINSSRSSVSPSGDMAVGRENVLGTPSDAPSPNSLFLFDETDQHVHRYRPSQNKLTKVKGYRNEMKTNVQCTACTTNEELYVFDCNRNAFRLDLIKKNPTWEQLEDMLYDHASGLQCTVHGCYIYVGGKNKMERYNVGLDVFESVELDGKICHRSALVAYEDRLYAIGGKHKGDAIEKVSRFRPDYLEWSSVSDMNIARQDASATVFNGRIYVAGGQSHGASLCDVEMYDRMLDSWTVFPKMNSARYLFRLCVIDGCLYAVGNGKGEFSAEFYDPKRKSWSQFHNHLEIEIWAPATVATTAPL